MKMSCYLSALLLLGLASCNSGGDSTSEEGSTGYSLCFCENTIEDSRQSYAFVVKGDDCCEDRPTSDYPSVIKSFESRGGNAWELVLTKKDKPKQVQSEACDLGIEVRTVAITGENSAFVNSVLTMGE